MIETSHNLSKRVTVSVMTHAVPLAHKMHEFK